ncbi:hypothetical protein GCM10022288_18200 [Gryllotalpicola kribbensis]|uniref:Mycofactocin n=1 Tax=Gryllotalpicola kribbensis TaxID=993084 RepID=A0ABP8ATB0_9MICO
MAELRDGGRAPRRVRARLPCHGDHLAPQLLRWHRVPRNVCSIAEESPRSTKIELRSSIDMTEKPVAADNTDDAIIESDVLVEEVSIDGMCGVY